MNTILQSFLASEQSVDWSLEQLTEALKGSKVNVFQVTPTDVEGLKDDVFAIKNESPVVDFLVTLLGIPRDGTAYKIRTGFMAYDNEKTVLFFSKNKYDLPAYLGKRPVKYGKPT